MDRRLNAGFEVPAGSLSVFLFSPSSSSPPSTSASWCRSPAASPAACRGSPAQRVGTGLVFATVAMAVAALVEKMRRDAANGEPASPSAPSGWCRSSSSWAPARRSPSSSSSSTP
ncbi:hypothetical protein ZWY2020_017782 [Hordeum vulgare]|nr:hypothetical protein ZWY2020_017782 [Hordeum vulgare]